tara:strand:+ start:866 stop:1396 length:531 start_codon:yes stop_codon:yes gene_type:complete
MLQTITILLTPQENLICMAEARRRVAHAFATHCKTDAADDRVLDLHYKGAQGEYVVHKFTGFPVYFGDDNIGVKTKSDVGPYEVKTASTRANEKNTKPLIVKSHNRLDADYILVEKYDNRTFSICGWMNGDEIAEKGTKTVYYQKPCYEVKQTMLHPVATIKKSNDESELRLWHLI